MHNSLWTSYDNTCRGVLSAQRIAFLGEQVRVHDENAKQWDKIAQAWEHVIAAGGQRPNTASETPEEGSR